MYFDDPTVDVRDWFIRLSQIAKTLRLNHIINLQKNTYLISQSFGSKLLVNKTQIS